MTEEFDESERKLSNGEGSRSEARECDNAWRFVSVPEEETEKWKMERERYDEMMEYIREVDEILDLIKPYPREGSLERRVEPSVRADFRKQSPRFGLDHLENIIKLVEQLKELQENNYKSVERSRYVKDLKKLREHKKRLKDEELEMRGRIRVVALPEDCETVSANRKSSSTSEKLERESKDRWQEKRKSICLGESRSKVSKWTKVKEAFHWEKASPAPKPFKRENSLGEGLQVEEGGGSRDDSPDDGSPPPPPPPPPPSRPDNLPSLQCLQDLPSSCSDRMDEYLSYSETKENKTSDLDSPVRPFGPDDGEEIESAARKSFCEDLAQIPEQLAKEEFSPSRSTKSNKTTWGKVKDIIQTRKDSLKKKQKKRGGEECKKRRKLSTVSNAQFSDQFEDLSSPEDKVRNITTEIIPKTVYDFQDEPSQTAVEVKCVKRLTPALTVTLPSTEELRSFSFDEFDKRDCAEEEKANILSQFSCQAQYCEDRSKFGKGKSGSNQRLSRWIKVKRVFLTSAAPARSPQYLPVNNSSPTSQNKSSGFFSDLESDDLSSGEWIDDKSPSLERQRPGYPEPQSTAMMIIQEDIRKSYNELQKKLSQEFDQKLREWGEAKSEALPKQEDAFPKPKGEDGDCIPKFRKTRESITVPLPNLNDLSPEFKKKLNDWKKMKTSQSSSSMSSSATKDEIQGQNIKIRIGEWQPWKNRCSGKGAPKGEQGDQFEEGQKSWGSSRPPANRRKDEEGGIVGSTSRRDSKRRDSVKKLSHSRTSSGGDSLISTSSAEKDGRFIRRSQKVKDFHWVEKELQKIEREKLRLEQEKEKYLEREARLEKMKRTMGRSPTQEILVRTPEGFIRFKGISQKFTKKLYEWEKARGIAPEASTFALLESAQAGAGGEPDSDGVFMQRSKSTGSVPELSSTLLIQTMANHPSSLSLNDVDELKREDETLSLEVKDTNEEPEAIIVDVEDVEEETAVLAEGPPVQSETPVYTYTSEEIDRITESKGRFYLSGEFDIKITSESETRGISSAAEALRDLGNRYRDADLRLEHAQTRSLGIVSGKFFKHQENEKAKGTAKVFQDAGEEEKTVQDPFLSAMPTCRYLKPKTKGLCDLRAEKTETSEAGISLPQSPQGFSQRLDKSETERRLISDRKATQDVAFERKDPLEVKPNAQILKRKVKEKITLMQRMSTEASWNADFRKQIEKRRTSEKEENVGRFETIPATEELLEESGSVSVFVPTTRKIISPVKTTDGATPSVCSYVIDDVKPETPMKVPSNAHDDSRVSSPNSTSPILRKKSDAEAVPVRDIGMPPLPNSPKTYKKLSAKETAPSIRMIIAKYNQKISEHDNAEGKRAESGSPVWRSPVFGRRTQEKTERSYEKENGRTNGEVQKSASLDNVRARTAHGSGLTPPQDLHAKGIPKSSSVGVMRIRSQNQDPPERSPPAEASKETSPSVLRALKIQKAKEDFLSGKSAASGDACTASTGDNLHDPEFREPEEEQSLKKAVSAETLTGESSRGESHSEKTSDSRPLHKSSSKFDISSIKSKFRKIRMRKEKDPKQNAVAVLCRQSLFIEVPKASETSAVSKSCPSSPVMDRNKHDKADQPPNK